MGLRPEQKAATLKHKVYVQKFTWRSQFSSEALFVSLSSECEACLCPV